MNRKVHFALINMLRLNLGLLPVIALCLGLRVNAQVVGFYNLENLFDTIDAPGVADEDFTPAGKLQYNTERMTTKVHNLSAVLDSCFVSREALLIGMCEVENRLVVDLLRKQLNRPSLAILHYESPDQRGIDNAILFDSTRLTLELSGHERVPLGATQRPTRDILWAVYKRNDDPTRMLVFVNHWPSRYGGAEETKWKRMQASETLTRLIDSLTAVYPESRLLVMGDFNDTPADESLLKLADRCNLVNLSEWMERAGLGTHAYRGAYHALDQVLIDRNWYNRLRAHGLEPKAETCAYPWMTYRSEKDGNLYPSRTYSGTRYFGGYSDHLPVTVVLE
ncbi:MAG: endonuclease [Salibacteraceae bacterium]